MAKAKEEKEQVVQEKLKLSTIEELAIETNTSMTVLAGMKVNENWSAGKRVTKEDFEAAKKKFLEAPLCDPNENLKEDK
jgi:hypothetical protein